MGRVIAGVNSLEAQKARIARFPIPADLSGKRVLDIGAWDGWFTFEMERRGAEVVAIDRWDNPRFREMHAALGSRAEYRRMNVYELSPAKAGAVRRSAVSRRAVSPEASAAGAGAGVLGDEEISPPWNRSRSLSASCRACNVEEYPLLQFFERDGFGGQFDNWFAPTPQCLLGMCRTAGFARAELIEVHDYGAAVACYRHWDVRQASRLSPGASNDRPGSLLHQLSRRSTRKISASISAPPKTTMCNAKPRIASLGPSKMFSPKPAVSRPLRFPC